MFGSNTSAVKKELSIIPETSQTRFVPIQGCTYVVRIFHTVQVLNIWKFATYDGFPLIQVVKYRLNRENGKKKKKKKIK